MKNFNYLKNRFLVVILCNLFISAKVFGVALDFATYIDGLGIGSGFSYDMAIASDGSPVIFGETSWGSNFPTTSGAYDTTKNGWEDYFITKLSPSGNSIEFSTFIGGSNSEYGTTFEDGGIALDNNDMICITGITASSDFPMLNAIDSTKGIGAEPFVAKLSTDGSSLIFSTFLSGSDNGDISKEIRTDSLNQIIISGKARSSDFPTQNAFFNSPLGDWDIFISKLSSNGSNLLFSTYFGGNDKDENAGFDTDLSGNIYIAGKTWSTDFPISSGALSNNIINHNIYISKILYDGSGLEFSTFLGTGQISANVYDIEIDLNGNSVITGNTSQFFPITPNAYSTTFGGGNSDIFVSKVSSDGSTLLFSTFLGGSNNENSFNISIDKSGNTYLVGKTESNDFPLHNALSSTFLGNYTQFICKLDSLGTSLKYSTFFTAYFVKNIKLFNDNYLYLAGHSSGGVPITIGSFNGVSNTWYPFVAKFNFNNLPPINTNPLLFKVYEEDSGSHLAISNLNQYFADPDSLELTFFSTVSDSGLISYILGDSLFVETTPNSDGIFTIFVTATDDSLASVSDSFLVLISSINDSPETFNLLEPIPQDTLQNLFAPIDFKWSPSYDVDNFDLEYNLRIYNSIFDTTISNISDTTLNFTNSLEELTTYSWFVEVTDGEFTVSSSDTFEFVTPMAVGISENENLIPKTFALGQNFPNPFNPSTTINYDLPINSKVILKIYNLLGQEVRTLVDRKINAGFHSINWDGKNNFGKQVSSGVYIYKIQAENFIQSKKMVFLK